MLEVEEREDATIVRLAHGKVNALDVELLQAIATAFGSLPPGRAVVLTGAGRSFSAGVDLKRVAEGGTDYVRAFRPWLSASVMAIFDHPGPVVAAINGHAIAGGCVLAAACDLRLMSGGTIGLSEMRVGVPFPAVPIEVMRHVMGLEVRQLVWDAEPLSPAQAYGIGLIDEVVAPESLLDAALAAAARLARIPAEVFGYTKRQLQGPARDRLASVSQAEEDAATRMWASPAVQAAISGFMSELKQQSSAEGRTEHPPIACPVKAAGQESDVPDP
jgi:enoyl-CoA hydratase